MDSDNFFASFSIDDSFSAGFYDEVPCEDSSSLDILFLDAGPGNEVRAFYESERAAGAQQGAPSDVADVE